MQGPGQECDDIAELEALWLSSQGQQRASQSSPGLQATTSAGQHCHVAYWQQCDHAASRTHFLNRMQQTHVLVHSSVGSISHVERPSQRWAVQRSKLKQRFMYTKFSEGRLIQPSLNCVYCGVYPSQELFLRNLYNLERCLLLLQIDIRHQLVSKAHFKCSLHQIRQKLGLSQPKATGLQLVLQQALHSHTVRLLPLTETNRMQSLAKSLSSLQQMKACDSSYIPLMQKDEDRMPLSRMMQSIGRHCHQQV